MCHQRTVQRNIYISPLLKHDLNGILLLKPLLGLNRQNTKVSIWFYACHCYRGLKTMLPISVAFSAMTFWQLRGFCCKVNAESTTDCRKGYEKGRPLTVSLCSNFSSEDIRLFWKVERELLGLPCFFCTSYAIYFNVPTQGVFLLSLHRLRATLKYRIKVPR